MKRKHEDILEPISKLQKDLENPDPHFRQNAVIGLGKYFENEEVSQKTIQNPDSIKDSGSERTLVIYSRD